jgi:flagellar biosynthesis/type III secretory pathway protein FliH
MSTLIKSSSGAVVRPLGAALRPPVSPLEEECERLRQRIAALEGELGRRDATIAELHAEIPRTEEKAKAEGRALGFNDAQDRQEERVALLDAGIRQAQTRLNENMSSLERLAALLARECLDTVLGDAKHRASSVRKIIASQVAKIEKSSVLAIELSKADFPDDEALAALAQELRPATLGASEAMAPGGCRMTLRLGTIEVGLDRQWTSLRAVLDSIAAEGRISTSTEGRA